MKNFGRWMVLVSSILLLMLSACAPKAPAAGKEQPVQLVPVTGTQLKRIVLSDMAAQRLGIQTASVRSQQFERTQVVMGEVIASPLKTMVIHAPHTGYIRTPADGGMPVTGTLLASGQVVLRLSPMVAADGYPSVTDLAVPGSFTLLKLLVAPGQFVEAGQPLVEVADLSEVWVRVLLNVNDKDRIDSLQPALVLALEDEDPEDGLEASAVEDPDGDLDEDSDDPEDMDMLLYYQLQNSMQKLTLGQYVRVKIMLSGSSAFRKVIPYSAVIYDTQGNTWVYTNPDPLVFVRQPIVIEYIADDQVILSEGLDNGSAVVTVGAAELFGAETGVSK